MINFIDLEDVYLIPSIVNDGINNINQFNFMVRGPLETSDTLPIMTLPCMCDVESQKTFSKNYINTVVSKDTPLDQRLDLCFSTFCAFTLEEVVATFLSNDSRFSSLPGIARICIDEHNGHYKEIFRIADALRKKFFYNVSLMGGNISNPDICELYYKSGFNYVRVGIWNGSTCRNSFGYKFPLVNMLIEIKKQKSKFPDLKIIADGGVNGYEDILKVLALGADYVMLGKDLAKMVDVGKIYKEDKTGKTQEISYPLAATEDDDYKIFKYYPEDRSPMFYQESTVACDGTRIPKKFPNVTKVVCNTTLEDWLIGLKNAFTTAFIMSNATNWQSFKEKVIYARY